MKYLLLFILIFAIGCSKQECSCMNENCGPKCKLSCDENSCTPGEKCCENCICNPFEK